MRQVDSPTILVFVGHYVPGYKAGGILRSVENWVNHLHPEFQFRIITRDRDLGDAAPYPSHESQKWQTVGNASVYYLSPNLESLSHIRALVNTTPHDLIRLNSFFDPLTIKVLVNRRLGRIGHKPIVVSPFGEFAWASLRQKYFKKTLFIWFARLTGLYSPVTWHAFSSSEADEIASVMKVQRETILVAADLPAIFTNVIDERATAIHTQPRDDLRVTFFSRISPEKNLDLALKILQQVRTKVTFDIIGPIENPAYWNECQKLILDLPPNVTARHIGIIKPTEVNATLGQYDLLLFPTGGESYGHVIGESLTAGTPVLISTDSPWRDMKSGGMGWDLPLNELGAFVRVIEELGATEQHVRRERRKTVKDSMRRILEDPPGVAANRHLYHLALAGEHSAGGNPQPSVDTCALGLEIVEKHDEE